MMSSVLPGFEYDIFISYRQKDNKGEGWVTEFVEALKTELEATFKEDISVYFDINPHDGLLETHDVADSLKEKLKALIFIPIVSRTYCDPNSYAWEHEFIAFIEQASQDRFGLKVKLPGGNVASRVLPVRIHDLEPEDIKLAESYLGFIRPVDFIYHSQGVNRPLRQRDDDLAKTGQQLVYRDQMNKVANALKDIIAGLKTGRGVALTDKESIDVWQVQNEQKEKIEKREKNEKNGKGINTIFSSKRKALSWAVGMVMLVIATALFVWPRAFKKNNLDSLRSPDGKISLAVMPFLNQSKDTLWDIWQDGIKDNLINTLSASDELAVKQPEMINLLIQNQNLVNYASLTPAMAGRISQKLDAKIFISGNIQKAGSTVRVNAQVFDSRTKNILQTFQIERPAEELNIFPMIDTLSLQIRDFLTISNLDRAGPPNFKYFQFTKSPEAFRFCLLAFKEYIKGDYQAAIPLFTKALEYDPDFYVAIKWLSTSCGNAGLFKEAKAWAQKLREKSHLMPLYWKIIAEEQYAVYWETPNEVLKYFKQLKELDPTDTRNYYMVAWSYSSLNEYDMAIAENEKLLDLMQKLGIKVTWFGYYGLLGDAYHKTGRLKQEYRLYKKAEKDFPNHPDLIFQEAVLAFSEGNISKGEKLIEQYKSVSKARSKTDAEILSDIGDLYFEGDRPEQAEKVYRQALASDPGNPLRMNLLAYLLIETRRNINEGIELVDKALALLPDNYEFLNTKGWGLFRLGKFQEAQEVLQKSWDIRIDQAVYEHKAYLHLEEAKKAAQK